MKAKYSLLRKKDHEHRSQSFFIKFQVIHEIPETCQQGPSRKSPWTQLRILVLDPEPVSPVTSSSAKGSFEYFEKFGDHQRLPFHSKGPIHLNYFWRFDLEITGLFFFFFFFQSFFELLI